MPEHTFDDFFACPVDRRLAVVAKALTERVSTHKLMHLFATVEPYRSLFSQEAIPRKYVRDKDDALRALEDAPRYAILLFSGCAVPRSFVYCAHDFGGRVSDITTPFDIGVRCPAPRAAALFGSSAILPVTSYNPNTDMISARVLGMSMRFHDLLNVRRVKIGAFMAEKARTFSEKRRLCWQIDSLCDVVVECYCEIAERHVRIVPHKFLRNFCCKLKRGMCATFSRTVDFVVQFVQSAHAIRGSLWFDPALTTHHIMTQLQETAALKISAAAARRASNSGPRWGSSRSGRGRQRRVRSNAAAVVVRDEIALQAQAQAQRG